ncbi:MAG: sodium/proline symporter [Gammaproteobacteria bacterium]|nr:sodium/proline symporter [Gammaproteobacteria bacterium]
MVLISFLFFLLVFVVIGALSLLVSKRSTTDYFLADQSISPWLASLSAVATNNSGYMFTGMIGFTYMNGLSSIWLMVGWIVGDFIGSLFLWRSIREAAEKYDLHSFSGLISRWWGQYYKKLRFISGILVLIFLGSYSAAQLNAGSKALHVLLGWDLSTGAWIGAIIVLIYSFAGGIRASIWTDAAQSFVMIIAMPLLMWLTIRHIGGWSAMLAELHNVKDGYMGWFPPGSTFFSASLFVLGWVFAGFGVVGQPHIMIRYMAVSDSKLMNRVRFYYYSWFTMFYGATIVVGLLARIVITNTAEFDSELALPTMAIKMMPDALVGLVLAGLFAATMSTADSLVLSCSAAISRDFRPDNPSSYGATKLATVTVVVVALGIALFGNKSVFQLVLLSWGLLAAAFAPLMMIYKFGRLPSESQCITIMLSGVIAYLFCHYTFISDYVYELMPAMLAAFLMYWFIHLFRGRIKQIEKVSSHKQYKDNVLGQDPGPR